METRSQQRYRTPIDYPKQGFSFVKLNEFWQSFQSMSPLQIVCLYIGYLLFLRKQLQLNGHKMAIEKTGPIISG